MTIEIRPCGPDELREGLHGIWHYFIGAPPEDPQLERMAAVLEPERVHAAWENGRAVGGAGAHSFELTVPGGRFVPAAGVTVVGVLPTHRRRGIMRDLMRAQLDDVHERGEPVAYLWASEDMIYGRFGYGMASMTGEIDLPRERAAFHGGDDREGNFRLLSLDEALEALPPLYDGIRPQFPGMFSRSQEWWRMQRLSDPPERRDGTGMVRMLVELDGRPAGYALYRHKPTWEGGAHTTPLTVIEALGESARADRAVWRYLLDVDWVARVRAFGLPTDHPLFFLLAEPRRLRFLLSDGLWVRLVDVGAALSARGYAAEGRVVFDVRDAFCPWNEGRWKLEGGEAARTEDEPDLALDVTALGSVYLGAYTFAELARAGRVDELRERALAQADGIFRADRQPWCPEVF